MTITEPSPLLPNLHSRTERYEDGPGTFLHRIFVEKLNHDFVAAAMLSQLYYWYTPTKKGASKLEVWGNKSKMYWVAKSHKGWESELGMTRMQVRRCLEVLARVGVIETCVMRFKNTPYVHCRLIAAGGRKVFTGTPEGIFSTSDLPAACTLADPIGYLQPIQHWLPAANPGLVTDNQSNTETTAETTAENTNTNTGSSFATAEFMNAKDILEKQAGKKTEGKYIPSTLSGVHENSPHVPAGAHVHVGAQAHTQAPAHPPASAYTPAHVGTHVGTGGGCGSLQARWKSLMANYWKGLGKEMFIPALKPKELGQLSHLKKACESQGADTYRTMGWVVEHWLTFALEAKTHKGLLTIPAVPNIGFTLAHYEIALQLIAQEKTQPTYGVKPLGWGYPTIPLSPPVSEAPGGHSVSPSGVAEGQHTEKDVISPQFGAETGPEQPELSESVEIVTAMPHNENLQSIAEISGGEISGGEVSEAYLEDKAYYTKLLQEKAAKKLAEQESMKKTLQALKEKHDATDHEHPDEHPDEYPHE